MMRDCVVWFIIRSVVVVLVLSVINADLHFVAIKLKSNFKIC